MRSFWLLVSFSFLVSTLSSFANDYPISNNPDDYDVVKYQRLYDNAIEKLQRSEELLSSLNARVREAEARLSAEQYKLERISQQIETNRATIATAQQRIPLLERQIQQDQAEIQRINSELVTLDRQVAEEQRRRDMLAGQVSTVEQSAQQANQEATQKEQEARSVQRQAEQKARELTDLNIRIGQLDNRIKALETEQQKLQTSLSDLHRREETLNVQTNQTSQEIEKLAREVEHKEQKYNQANAEAAELERKAAEAAANNDPHANQLARQAAHARQKANQAKAEFERSKQELAQLSARLSKLNSELAKVRESIRNNQRRIAEIQTELQRTRQELSQAQAQVQTVNNEYQKLNQRAEALVQEAQRARARASQLNQRLSTLKKELAESERRLAELSYRPQQLRQRLAHLQQQVTSNNRELQEQRAVIASTSSKLRELSREFEAQQRTVQTLAAQLSSLVRDRDQAARIVQDNRQEVAFYQRRLAEVSENLRQGIAVATTDGQVDGKTDGTREGTRQGNINGTRDGQDVGSREGRAAGTRDGVQRARSQGSEQGNEVGTTEGTEKGSFEGQEKGKAEGTEKGRAEGLVAGFESGRKEGDASGYAEGTEYGHGLDGYNKGYEEGFKTGSDRATDEATAKGRSDGYRQAEKEFYAAELSEVSIENRSGVSTVFDRGNWENYNPHRHYPHPALQQAYERSYQDAFIHFAGVSYDRVYEDVYRRTFDMAYSVNYQEYVNREYPHEYKNAFDQAYQSSFRRSYEQSYRAGYDNAYSGSYEVAYQEALNVRFEEGRKIGWESGFARGKDEAYNADFTKGKTTGDQEGYDQAYQPAYDQGFEKGRQAADGFFSTNAVLSYDGALIIDEDEDSVFAPGDKASVSVVLKNFGKVSQDKDIQIKLSNATSGIELINATDVVTKIPGQSRATVSGITELLVKESAAIGSKQSVDVAVVYKGGLLGKATLEFEVGYPYSVTGIETAKLVAPNEDNYVTVTIKNLSQRDSENVTVKLVSTDNLAVVSEAFELGQLTAGEEKEANFAFHFTEAYKKLGFEVQIFESDRLLGVRSFSVDSTKRWVFNPASNGLIVVGLPDIAERFEAAGKYAGLSYDVWDVRFEGELTLDIATKYLNKSLVIPSIGNEFSRDSALAVHNYLEKGGSVYATLNPDKSTPMRNVLVMYSQGYLTVTFERTFQFLLVYQGNMFLPRAERTVVMGGYKDFETVQGVARDLFTFKMITSIFSEKVTTFIRTFNNGTTIGRRDDLQMKQSRAAIVRELAKEMFDDKETKGDRYKKNKTATLLAKFVNIALSKTGPARKALIEFYPDLEKARKVIKANTGDVLEPLKKAYKKEIGK